MAAGSLLACDWAARLRLDWTEINTALRWQQFRVTLGRCYAGTQFPVTLGLTLTLGFDETAVLMIAQFDHHIMQLHSCTPSASSSAPQNSA
jgi:hypothetical protein